MFPKSRFSKPIFGHSAGSTKLDRPYCKRFWLVSHYSAIGDTISCGAPSSAIGFRGKLCLRYSPPPRPVFGLRKAIFTERSGGVAAIVYDITENTARHGVLLHLSCDKGVFRSGHWVEVFWRTFFASCKMITLQSKFLRMLSCKQRHTSDSNITEKNV